MEIGKIIESLMSLDEAVKYGNNRYLVDTMAEMSELVGIEYISDYDVWKKGLVDKIQGE